MRHEEEPEWMLGRAFPLWITFREQKKADQFQIDGPVTLISKWRSVNERERERESGGEELVTRRHNLPVLYSREGEEEGLEEV